jgi:hypothetical protein
MTQYDFGALSPADSGPTLAAKLSGVIPALLTHHKGPTRPSYTQPGMLWINDAGATWLLNLFDGEEDVTIAGINPATHQLQTTGVPATRKVRTGSAFLLNGVAGSDEEPAEATLAADLLIKLIFASTAVSIEGAREDLPVHPAGMKAAIDEALGKILANIGTPAPSGAPVVMTASGNYSPSAGTKLLLGILCGGGGQGGGGGSGGGGGGGGGGCCVFLVKVTDGSTFAVSIGAAGSGGSSNQNGLAGSATSVTVGGVTYTANGGAGGVKAGSGSGTPYQGGAGGASVNGLFGFVGNDGSNGSSTAIGNGGKSSAPAAEAATYGRGGNGVTSGSGLVGTGGFAKFVEFK